MPPRLRQFLAICLAGLIGLTPVLVFAEPTEHAAMHSMNQMDSCLQHASDDCNDNGTCKMAHCFSQILYVTLPMTFKTVMLTVRDLSATDISPSSTDLSSLYRPPRA